MGLRGARVAITGASSGIGAAAAEAFAREGCRLALAGRKAEALVEVAERCKAAGAAEVRTAIVDVMRRDDVEAWARELREAWSGVDVAVANAGVGHFGPFADMLPEHQDMVVQTNVLGVWRTAQAFLPLLSQARGHLVVVGSVAGRIPMPYLSTYCATKAALVGWTRSVRPELAREGVALTLFAPGATRTQFARRALRQRGVKGVDLAGEGIIQHRGADRLLAGHTPEQVARALVRAARWRPREVHLTASGIAGVWVAGLAPHLLARIVEPLMRPRKSGGGAGNWKYPPNG